MSLTKSGQLGMSSYPWTLGMRQSSDGPVASRGRVVLNCWVTVVLGIAGYGRVYCWSLGKRSFLDLKNNARGAAHRACWMYELWLR